jgi:hypothetical protein
MLRLLVAVLLIMPLPALAQNIGSMTEQQRRSWYEQQRRREHAREERRDNTIFGDRYAPWWRMERVCTAVFGRDY